MSWVVETALFTAADKGQFDVVKELLPYTTREALSFKNRSGFDALHIAANQGYKDIVELLLDFDPGLIKTVAQSNATPLISAATRGTRSLLEGLIRKDKLRFIWLSKEWVNCEVVKLLLAADAASVMLPDKFGNTALHVATRKKRGRDENKTALDFAEALPISEEILEIKDSPYSLRCSVKANDLNQPRDELRGKP
ncbi:unnamed protein product [Vicia faba]|uniref:Uncharacterized protein n=1 Tax=Vicia faba TaxID=3906 RepID=A0AAV1AZE1_VICFA|nr:unnamed protein product [Vicia faba]